MGCSCFCLLCASRTVLTVLVCCLWLGSPPALAQDVSAWEEIPASREPDPGPLPVDGPEVTEPVFAFLVNLAAGDSLGSWTGEDIRAFAADRGTPSRFPVELVERITRRRPEVEAKKAWPQAAVRAVWEVTLTEPLDRSMPYSILGYHPGSLRVSRQLLLTEVLGGTLALPVGQKALLVTDVIMLRLDQGHVILDVDGLVDRLLGSALDDAGTVGFVLAREEGQLLGLAVSLGRNGRRIYGEFDFRRDKVLPNGRTLAKVLSAACRQRMLEGYEGPELGAWVDD